MNCRTRSRTGSTFSCAHSRAHIVEAARESGLTPVRIDDAVLRQEYGEPVEGLVVTLMRVGT